MPDFFGLPGIFDNVRDGLVLVRFPEGEIVLFNRAAARMCSVDPAQAMGTDFARVLTDPEVQAQARRSASQPVGKWPGHDQDAVLTEIGSGAGGATVEVSICRVEDVGTGGPLVLFVMRPGPDAALEATLEKVGLVQPAGHAA